VPTPAPRVRVQAVVDMQRPQPPRPLPGLGECGQERCGIDPPAEGDAERQVGITGQELCQARSEPRGAKALAIAGVRAGRGGL